VPSLATAYSENGWVDAQAVADYLATDRDFVYRNARELGGRKLGAGPKAPWRFKLALVDGALEAFTCPDSRGLKRTSSRCPRRSGAVGRIADRALERRCCPYAGRHPAFRHPSAS
jgi:hypothetical protein